MAVPNDTNPQSYLQETKTIPGQTLTALVHKQLYTE
jgi:hypothetical protein